MALLDNLHEKQHFYDILACLILNIMTDSAHSEEKNNNRLLAVFLTNEKCPKLLYGLVLATVGDRLFQCGTVWVEELLKASLYVWYLQVH